MEIGLFVAGVLLGWFVSRHFYRRSSEDLGRAKEETLRFNKPVGAEAVLGSDGAMASVNRPGWTAPTQDETPPAKIP
jgi:hypothetical protein